MKRVNLRELYPDAYGDDEYVDVSDEVYESDDIQSVIST